MSNVQPTDKKARRRGLHPLVHLALALLVLGLLQGFVIKPYTIPSASMEPTLMTGDRVLVNRLAYIADGPEPGDLVVFNGDEQWGPNPTDNDSVIEYAVKWLGSLIGVGPGVEHAMAKRVIAVGGQTLECCDSSGAMIIDGQPVDASPGSEFLFEPGSLDCSTVPASQRCLPSLVVPEGHVVVAGDNRTNSLDSLTQCRDPRAESSCLLTVDTSDVVGKVVFRWAPLRSFGPL